MVSRDEALNILKKNLKNKNLRKHCLAAEAIMRKLAEHFGEDKELWGMAGLLHDIDYEETHDDPNRHSLVGGEMLAEMGFPEELVHAVKAHNEVHGIERESLLDKALYAVDPLTGLIVAAALIKPEKKLAAIDVNFILNRFKEKSFARGASREQIQCCSELGLELEEFIEIGLKAMQEIADDLGL
ncbi:MAG: Metal dependent phosphohydrolase [Clostridia bacterium 41_269]|nr:MAG: Metal dependent phosphohydrolase [Clostridia bacterium 41_269]